jgi:predicted DNA-binding antitoxin AbrB/MazE fold protein
MSQQIDAIYDNGVLKPLAPLSLPDKARVKLTVETQPLEGSDSTISVGAEFDAALEPLLFDGPKLPADFSRADIYSAPKPAGSKINC